MRSYRDDSPNKVIFEKVLNSIPCKYDAIVTTIEQTKNLYCRHDNDTIESLAVYGQRSSRHDIGKFAYFLLGIFFNQIPWKIWQEISEFLVVIIKFKTTC